MAKQKHKGLTITAIGSIPLILVLGNSMLVPILPELKKQLHISEFQSSLVISAFSIAAAITIPILGYLSDRFTRKAVVIPALTLYGLGGLLAGVAAAWFNPDQKFAWILVGRIIQGIGAAGTTSMAMALAGDLFEGGEQSKVLGIVEASNGFGKVLSPIIGSLLALLFWYAAFFAFPVFCFISILLTIFFIKEKTEQRNNDETIFKRVRCCFPFRREMAFNCLFDRGDVFIFSVWHSFLHFRSVGSRLQN